MTRTSAGMPRGATRTFQRKAPSSFIPSSPNSRVEPTSSTINTSCSLHVRNMSPASTAPSSLGRRAAPPPCLSTLDPSTTSLHGPQRRCFRFTWIHPPSSCSCAGCFGRVFASIIDTSSLMREMASLREAATTGRFTAPSFTRSAPSSRYAPICSKASIISRVPLALFRAFLPPPRSTHPKNRPFEQTACCGVHEERSMRCPALLPRVLRTCCGAGTEQPTRGFCTTALSAANCTARTKSSSATRK
mmetsp:Transcript_46913/g.110450  ORF Transcript_46913/g.110450 Transcript_46913/m.110450 type:complete len:246 (-) Transcript_46913:300-1037(-)